MLNYTLLMCEAANGGRGYKSSRRLFVFKTTRQQQFIISCTAIHAFTHVISNQFWQVTSTLFKGKFKGFFPMYLEHTNPARCITTDWIDWHCS